MNARASFAAAAASRWSAMRRTCSRRACFCSWLGKCMRVGSAQQGKPILSPKRALGIVRARGSDTTMKYQLAAAALVAWVAVGAAHAQEIGGTLKKVRDSGSITIGYRENSVPFSYVDGRQQPIGYSMDLCAAVIEEIKK